MSEGIWYDINRIRSYNRVLNFVIGARGIGKTFGFKDWAVSDFIETGNQFIYMRRFKEELINRKAKEGFFPRALKDKYPEHQLEFKDGAYLVDGRVAGYPMVLSKAGQEKGVIEYDLVNKVLFDEFIIDKKSYHYLPSETDTFKEAMITIARLRFVQFFLFSNSVSWNNPYFVKYGIEQPADDIEFMKTKSWVVQRPIQSEYVAVAEQSPLGQLFKDIDNKYFEYAYENKTLRDSADFIEKKSAKARHRFNITYMGIKIAVWVDYDLNMVYCCQKFDSNVLVNFVLNSDDHTENTILLSNRKNSFIKMFVDAFQHSRVRYENQQTKSLVYDIMKILM